MNHYLLEKKAKVLIVDSSGVLRPVLSSILKDFGYKTVSSVKTIEEALQFIVAEPISWIITHLYSLKKITAIHLLRLCLKHNCLRKIRISILFDESEKVYIPFAYSYGLFSWHDSEVTTQYLRGELKELTTSLRNNEGNDVITAAQSLRSYLHKHKLYDELCRFEERLLKDFFTDANQFMHLGEAQLLNNQLEEGGSTLYQAILADSSYTEEANKLAEQYLGRKLTLSDQKLKIETCILVDSDAAAKTPFLALLGQLGAKTVLDFDSPLEALDYLKKNKKVDLVICEWKLRKISAPAFIQRLRSEEYEPFPIIINSSLIKKEDFDLLKEMGVANVIPKPVKPKKAFTTILSTIRQHHHPSQGATLERKIRLLLNMGNPKEAKALAKKLFDNSTIPDQYKLPIRAEFAFVDNNYDLAKSFALKSLNLIGPTVFILNLLGKCFMKTNDVETAIKYFEKAQSMSPHNLKRLCQISEAYSKEENLDKAQNTLKMAKEVDPDSPQIKEQELSLAVKNNDTQKADELLGDIGADSSLISFWNNQAISYARKGNFKDSYETYKRALDTLPKGDSDIRSYLSYNLALAYLRNNDLKSAKPHLDAGSKVAGSPISLKVKSLWKRVTKSLETGEKFKLQERENHLTQGKTDDSVVVETELVDLVPGDYALYGIYKFSGELPSGVKAFTTDLPNIENRLSPELTIFDAKKSG